ncbi:MAG TPA: hypothetical protein VLY45_01030 [Nitrospiria bacterium]|nr:hypothetical protein [Nitrospiria bacterium]
MADSTNAVIETNKTDTTFGSTKTVTVPRPDRVVSALLLKAATVKAGGSASVTNTIKNQVDSRTGWSVADIHLSTNQTYGDDIASALHERLPPRDQPDRSWPFARRA